MDRSRQHSQLLALLALNFELFLTRNVHEVQDLAFLVVEGDLHAFDYESLVLLSALKLLFVRVVKHRICFDTV